jgi:hypothetical protein
VSESRVPETTDVGLVAGEVEFARMEFESSKELEAKQEEEVGL